MRSAKQQREWKVLTTGQRLAAIVSLQGDTGISHMDYHDMCRLADQLPVEPARACLIDFSQKEIERIHVLFNRFFIAFDR